MHIVYICTHVLFIYSYVCAYIKMYVYLYICKYNTATSGQCETLIGPTGIYIYISIYVYVFIFMYSCIIYLCICMSIYEKNCIFIYLYK
jgi:hypothetical protein